MDSCDSTPDSSHTNINNNNNTLTSDNSGIKRTKKQSNKQQKRGCRSSGPCTTSSSKPSNIPSSDDPVCYIPKNDSELQTRLSRGPHQPRLDGFPRTKIGIKQRSFQADWYDKYKWLEYSASKDAAFCFYCRFFSPNDGHTNPAFIDKGFRNWHRANECFQNHQLSKSHVHSYSAWLLDEDRQAYLSKQEEIRCHNRNMMERMIDLVLCLAKSNEQSGEKRDGSLEKDLFLRFINMLGKYDPVMAKYLDKSSEDANYLSMQIQNNLIIALRKVIQQKIVSSISGKMVSLIVDETTDCGHQRHVSITVRYFDDVKHSPVEHFVCVQRIETIDDQTIFNELNKALVGILKIDWSSVLSVCFDGAHGCNSGVGNRCKEQNSGILTVHCYTHCLNLVLVDACISRKENITIFDFFGVIQTLYAFMEDSTTEHELVEKVWREVGSQLKTLQSLSNVRWACRAEAVAAVRANYSSLLRALEEIFENTCLPDLKIKARGLIRELNSFGFIFSLHMMHPILQMLAKVSKALQAPDFNLLTNMTMTKSLRNSLSSMRNSPDYFKSIFYDSIKVCEESAVSVPPVKKQKVSTHMENPSIFASHYLDVFSSLEEQERTLSFFPLIDSMICAIDQRFEHNTYRIVSAVGKVLNLDTSDDDVRVFSDRFNVSLDELRAEVELLRGYESVPKGSTASTVRNWLDWLKEENRLSMFPAFYKSIQYFSVLPLTSCSCDSLSKLTLVKNYLKNYTSQQCLNDSIITLNVEQELISSLDYNNVIEEFKLLSPNE